MTPDVKYVIAGRGHKRRRLEALVTQLGLDSHVAFLGYLPSASLPDRLREADVYASAYLEDGVSMSLLEAMACGLLPVVPDTEPNRLWVQDGVMGYCSVLTTMPPLVHKLLEALLNSSLRRQARAHNIRLIQEKVNWHTNMRRLEAMFRQVIAHSTTHARLQ
jgi:glycosyltransferase involved in cell wall biosynthesis